MGVEILPVAYTGEILEISADLIGLYWATGLESRLISNGNKTPFDIGSLSNIFEE